MKKGFTMIELIFVIVILGILAAVAIPRLAATRDDAKLAAVKTDIGTFMNAVPAWYQGQKDARIAEAVGLDTAQWKKDTTGKESYTLQMDGKDCVTIAVWDVNTTSATGLPATIGLATTDDINTSSGLWSGANTPYFRVIQGGVNSLGVVNTYAGSAVCDTLWSSTGLGVTEANITMAGKKVQW